VRGKVVEDVALARRIKKAGMRLRMVDGNDMLSCKMYEGWKQVRHGFGKNILPGHGDSVLVLLLSTVFHWLVFVGPWLWLLLGWLIPVPGYPWWPLILIAAGIGLRAVTAAFTRQRARDALYMPASVLLMTIIAIQAIYWQVFYGGPWWRDRVIKVME
jgi:chlorobactene glucosyltransferase